jgi:hypothetical protein
MSAEAEKAWALVHAFLVNELLMGTPARGLARIAEDRVWLAIITGRI